jgi:two-component system, chemotaxis family, protein-glutamate methylesterase/glutaminase
MVVDDSALVRKLLSEILRSDPELEVVGTAGDPYEAREKIRALNPDVLTLDVEMPKMDGVTFLRNLMRLRPMPVVMVSSLTEKGAEVTMAALECGAVDFVTKPKIDLAAGLAQDAELLINSVKAAARANLSRFKDRTQPAPRVVRPTGSLNLRTTDQLIAIGASTGGTEAVAEVLHGFPADAPGTLITQHIPEIFSRRWAERMNETCAVTVREAVDGEQILLGHVYVAPGGTHLRVTRSGARFYCRISVDEPVNRHRPSVDVLFDSIISSAGSNAVAALLTGMGADGAQGLKRMRAAGIATIAQDEATSVVWGMPGEAVKLGAACEVLPIERIAERLLVLSKRAPVAATG